MEALAEINADQVKLRCVNDACSTTENIGPQLRSRNSVIGKPFNRIKVLCRNFTNTINPLRDVRWLLEPKHISQSSLGTSNANYNLNGGKFTYALTTPIYQMCHTTPSIPENDSRCYRS